MARLTFATTVALSNDLLSETVLKLLSYTKLTATQVYARAVEKKVSQDMEKLKLILRGI